MPSYEAWAAVGLETESRSQTSSRQGSADPSRLGPEDAYSVHAPPRLGARQQSVLGLGALNVVGGRTSIEPRRKSHTERSRSRRTAQWKKLLWVEQQYPDNYTDEETFLQDLKRNPTFRQYEFWPLMADATVIIQHLCSVAIFLCCFTAIYQERVSPVTVVGWGSSGTVFGWILWDFWVAQEQVEEAKATASGATDNTSEEPLSATSVEAPTIHTDIKSLKGLGLTGLPGDALATSPIRGHAHRASAVSVVSNSSAISSLTTGHPTGAPSFASYSNQTLYGESAYSLSPRMQQRLGTAKSAILIYCALLGLSPILKSLTMSTTSDSIWAMSCWLILINVAFFDYGGGVSAKISGSLSTNAALMASTVLASRLPSTTHVFSLTLFSIEVFGLFPVFRRHLRHMSWVGHLTLSIFLILSAGGGVGITVSGGGWTAALVGMVLGGLSTFLAMGICSWWLIGLQKYKNEIQGPWDPARPVLRRRWD